MVDVPAQHDTGLTPMFVLHGYPTCSYDWVHVLPELSRDRRVVLLDFPGFGLSDKPDVRYGTRLYADAAVAVAARPASNESCWSRTTWATPSAASCSHARMEGALPFSVERRLLSNGSIYIGMAQLSAGQQALLAADDALFDLAGGRHRSGARVLQRCRGHVFAVAPPSEEEKEVQWLFAVAQRTVTRCWPARSGTSRTDGPRRRASPERSSAIRRRSVSCGAGSTRLPCTR